MTEYHTARADASAKDGDSCECCGEAIVEIKLLIDGEHLTMRSCSLCDTRSWHRGDDEVELAGVLADLSATRTRYRRDLASR